REFQEAVQHLERAARLDPENTSIQGRLQEARTALLANKQAVGLRRRAHEELELRNLSKSVDYAVQATALDPGSPDGHSLVKTIRREIERDATERLELGLVRIRELLERFAFDQALAALTELEQQFPEQLQLLELATEARSRRADYEQRQERFRVGLLRAKQL